MNSYWKPAELRAAIERDADDVEAVYAAISALRAASIRLHGLDEVQHPDARWQIADAIEALAEHIANAEATLLVIRRTPGVVEE